ncbi:VOC family protein [Prochlorothrix hollandica]|uniref:VOC domain-containing protein n=2 Tax=Prochlorothrix hollandica TaxID=1223 RepID=A0A0M2PUZ2_PROHO|nr:VOC family protein [Prochlorothrix hollandica]KKI98468.1 hypothetical protein PROH_18775 [Prochlorothrix hollandica PCC 9006 = CALU 1027]
MRDQLPWLGSGFVAIAALDLEPLIQFYRRLWQQDPHPYEGDRYGEFHLGSLRLVLFRPQGSQGASFAPTPPGSLSICVTVRDLAAAIAHCQDLGLTVDPPLKASHGQEFQIRDPLGNRIIFYQPT